MYRNDRRVVITLDAGGTNLVFSAMRGYEYIVEPITLPSEAQDLDKCLSAMVRGFREVISRLDEKPVAISFAFPGPADYRNGIIGGFLPNFPSFRDGVALGPFLSREFGLPVFINNDGDLFALGEAKGGMLPEINRRVHEMGGARKYNNLLGYTFGTGFGIGSVINGQLNLGNNSCVETFCLPNKHNPEYICEDSVAIRAIQREYGRHAGVDGSALTPYDVFLIAEGKKEGNPEAARKAFEHFGQAAGNAMAIAVTLTDSLIVIGGGVTGAAKYIMPSLLGELRSKLRTVEGPLTGRVQLEVFNLDDDAEFARFVRGEARPLKVYGSDAEVVYDPMRRTGVAISKLGASKAISIGAYTYALTQLDCSR